MDARRTAKTALIHMLRFSGMFSICERLTASGLQILCYHGISQLDEHLFRPKLFMSRELFSARMDWLSSEGYHVLSLRDALQHLDNGDLPRRAVVITFDDGWYGCLRGAFDKLVSLDYPVTMYSTTYYSQKRRPTFNIAVPYLLWRGREIPLNLKELNNNFKERVHLVNPGERDVAADQIIKFGNTLSGLQERTDLLYRLAELVKINPVDLFEHQRVCTLMNEEELTEASSMGIDVQLHTHRHRFPLDDDDALRREISDNREVLHACGVRDLSDLCYPSGVYDPGVFSTLRSEGIETATTTDAGLNYPNGERLALGRFLDATNISPIEFHSEMSGVLEVLRQLRAGHSPWSGR